MAEDFPHYNRILNRSDQPHAATTPRAPRPPPPLEPCPAPDEGASKIGQFSSGEGGIRTLGTLWVHTLSRRAPSAARAPLRRANRRKCRREVQAGRGTLRVVECARGPQCGSRSRRHGWHTTLATSARSAAAPPAATRRRQPSLRPASADRRRPRGEPPRRHP